MTEVKALGSQRGKVSAQCLAMLIVLLSTGCSTTAVEPDSARPLILPAEVKDERGRFREVFCAVLEARAEELDDYEPCDTALTTAGVEPAGSGEPVNLGHTTRDLTMAIVPGVGWGCFDNWLDLHKTGKRHVERFGYGASAIPVEALSSSAVNARHVRDYVQAYAEKGKSRELVLVGYSKGAVDVLRALVDYPEIQPLVSAVVSISGCIGGSALADDATQSQLELMTLWPGAECDGGDGQGLNSMKTDVRQQWLANNKLPVDIPYYSVVTMPDPDRISFVLRPSWRKLSEIDTRNDSQVVYSDQIIPGSTLVGFINADHWAVAVPLKREHEIIGATLVSHNNYPREALLEAILRYVEEDMDRAQGQ